ncbi:SH3 domain-containing protein [Stappia sp. 28M-7]|uniref:SH3 domain-containing protein n=1 Tax=Stappia sp. 28M-7 TaxID=2762596 RepID=UPI00163BB760|nr:SH3 domain-containing protein [Stappia sp. 28M-7]MBC2859174.1 SH3 domain-containing protein [Stappia sp. 28M-7]
MTLFRSLAMAAVAAAVVLAAPAALAMEMRTERIDIPRGAAGTEIAGMIKGEEFVEYLLPVTTGQQVSLSLSSSNRYVHMGVAEPGSRREVFDGSHQGAKYSGRASEAGDYRIRVRLSIDGVARNETARYVLTVASVRAGQTRPQRPDPQPGTGGGRPPGGNQGGGNAGTPEFWQVTGVSAGDFLNLRSGPNTSNPVVARLANGEVLRNLGCHMVTGQSWCRVERPNGRDNGWVSATYLREGSNRPGRPDRPDRPGTGRPDRPDRPGIGRPGRPERPRMDMDDGGPDFWRVTGISGRDYLNVRTGPGTGFPITARLSDGELLRNLGCGRLVGERQRWCQVERRNGDAKGWVAGDFLREGHLGQGDGRPDRPGRPNRPGRPGDDRPGDWRPDRPDRPSRPDPLPGPGPFPGPDPRASYFEVTGLSSSGLLNVRSGPGTGYSVIGRVANGDVLIDRGCRAVGTQTWCRIQLLGGEESGWVSANYLRQTRYRPGRGGWR